MDLIHKEETLILLIINQAVLKNIFYMFANISDRKIYGKHVQRNSLCRIFSHYFLLVNN